MTDSYTPPPASGGAKFAAIGLALLVGAGVLAWFTLGSGCGEEPVEDAKPAEAAPEKPAEAAYVDSMDIPDSVDELAEPVPEATAEAAAPAGKKRVGGTRISCNGTLPKASARKALAKYRGEVRSCYEKALKNDNLLQGKLTLTLNVSRTGSISRVGFAGIKDTSLRSCVKARVGNWTFPKPEGGCATIAAPFNLKPSS